MLTKEQLTELKSSLKGMKHELEERLSGQHYGLDFELIKESVGELSNYDNHPGDHGTELYEREKDIALNEHSEHYLDQINAALQAIDKEEYGVCEKCGEPIPYERLEAVPTTRRCIEHSEENIVTNQRPVEEDVLKPAFGKFEYDESNENQTFFDSEDAWQAVSVYGSSESPSDFSDTEKDYNSMFVESEENVGIVEDVEGIITADISGNFSGVSVDHRKYENYLDENDADSIFDNNEQ
ncbi:MULTISPECIES: TraR/DksA C4-type zinc finger protein [Bacillaceae]|uniref:TraR/DksA C4-type zinc finger protein n=1 Tax=Evansella alkalicola TaxID=745819 RepID=A0ABS6JZU7_9BACI|nr:MULTISPECIES: TraR/DksA C4-type zinc finger protein [Bacillaceae]MBU9723742.1 TraR/DksA C4-type zinc finger protein [Bacillus alkalicola]